MTAYYAFWVSNRTPRDARSDIPGVSPSLRWSLPFADAPAAKACARRQLGEGRATLAFVVRYDGDGDGPGRVYRVIPESARAIVDHYLSLLEAIRHGRPPEGR